MYFKTNGFACGPYNPIIPTPGFFHTSKYSEIVEKADLEREENLKLWQNLTSSKIPLSDIEQAVYRDSCDKFNKDFDEAYDLLSDEAKAKVQYMSGNLKTVIKKFPKTEIALFVKNSCDRWKDWM